MSQDRPSCLAILFAPLPRERFLAEHWPVAHCVSHGDPQRLASLFALPELQSVDALLACAQRDVKAVFVDAEQKYQEIAVEPPQARLLYRAGMSVCLGAVDRWVPGLRAWVDGLVEELGLIGAESKCNAYASRQGSGFAKHWDGHEVVVVQLSGHKRWRIAPNREVPFPKHNYVPAADPPAELRVYMPYDLPEEMPPDTLEVEMRPGSVLFLPRGTWHMTEAQEGDSLSLTFSLHLPAWLDLLTHHVKQTLLRSPCWREPAVGIWGGGDRRAARQRLAALLERLGEDLAPLTAGDLIREYSAAQELAVPPEEERIWARLPLTLTVHPRADGMAEVRIEPAGGERVEIEIDEEMVPVFSWICDRTEPFTSRDVREQVPGLPPETIAQIVSTLEDSGVLAALPGS